MQALCRHSAWRTRADSISFGLKVLHEVEVPGSRTAWTERSATGRWLDRWKETMMSLFLDIFTKVFFILSPFFSVSMFLSL